MGMDDVIIYGAGKYGEIAYEIYHRNCNIVCYVDRDKAKWGTCLHDTKIMPPEVLQGFRGKVIITVQKDTRQIEEELKTKYGISLFLEFRAVLKGKCVEKPQPLCINSIVMVYMGGLGNQLFQYALAKYLIAKGKNVIADIIDYSKVYSRSFELMNVVQDGEFQFASEEICEYYKMKESIAKIEGSDEKYFFLEPDIAEYKKYKVSEEWGRINRGIVMGYFQTYFFADEVRESLLDCIKFHKIKGCGIRQLAEKIRKGNSVSIHVRRGDYIKEKERRLDGICSREYYESAVAEIRKKVKNPKFYIFSDDIAWCRENIRVEDAFYFDGEEEENYLDWYDMYLMSICGHNIIANSSFSWWGAWLNQNPEKIVIAPRKWDNFCELENLCPPDWMRL